MSRVVPGGRYRASCTSDGPNGRYHIFGLDVQKATVYVAVAESGCGGEVRQVEVFENHPEILRQNGRNAPVFGSRLRPRSPLPRAVTLKQIRSAHPRSRAPVGFPSMPASPGRIPSIDSRQPPVPGTASTAVLVLSVRRRRGACGVRKADAARQLV
jgi:hypothetical protein